MHVVDPMRNILVFDEMFGILAVVIVHLVYTPKLGLCDKLSSDRMLTKGLASVVDSWSSALVNPVVVYGGFDVDIPCMGNDKNDDASQTVASNKSYIWYDSDNKTVSKTICRDNRPTSAIYHRLTVG